MDSLELYKSGMHQAVDSIGDILQNLGDAHHGGFYPDFDTARINVFFTEDISAPVKSALLFTGIPFMQDRIVFKAVRYTLAQLEELKSLIAENLMSKFGIHIMYRDPRVNHVILGTDDDSDEYKSDIHNELHRLGFFNVDMLEIHKMNHISSCDAIDLRNTSFYTTSAADAVLAATFKVHPGGWIGIRQGSGWSFSSLTTGLIYNGQYGFLSCGHAKSVGDTIYYLPIPSSGTYNSGFNPSLSDVKVIGTVAGTYFTDNNPYDCASIKLTNNSATMSPTNYAGGAISGEGPPQSGWTLGFSGCVTKFKKGTCLDPSTPMYVDGLLKTQSIVMDTALTKGNSGGPLAYYSGEKWYLCGILSGSNTEYNFSVFTNYPVTRSRFGFTTVF